MGFPRQDNRVFIKAFFLSSNKYPIEFADKMAIGNVGSTAEFTQNLELHLSAVAEGSESSKIQASTAALGKNFYSSPLCIPSLLEIVARSTNESVRMLASVELRKRASKNSLWNKLPDETRSAVKKTLTEMVLAENTKSIRQNISRVITEIARMDLPAGKWDELMQFTYSCCQSPNPSQREVGFFIILSLVEVLEGALRQHLVHIFQLYAHGLRDNESLDVRVYTVEGLGRLANLIEPKDEAAIKSFQGLVPDILAVVHVMIDANQLSKALTAMEVFIDLVMEDTPLLSQHIPQTIEFFLSIASKSEISPDIRNQALTFLMFVSIYKKSSISKGKLVAPLVHHLMVIGAEPEPEDTDEEVPAKLAFKVINTLAMNLPPQQIFPVVWDTFGGFIRNSNPGHRKSAIMSFASLAEGCSDYIRNEFKVTNIMPFVIECLRDQDWFVRRAALIALASLSADLGAEVVQYHAEVLPLLFSSLQENNEQIRKVSLESLEMFLEEMGELIYPYLTPLMEKLVSMLDQADDEIKLTIVGAIGSAAHASGTEFQKFFPHIVGRFESYMSLTDADNDEQMMLRGSATDAIAAIATAVGPEQFSPYLSKFMDIAMKSIDIGALQLAESSFGFFGAAAKLYGRDFGPFLGPVVERLFAACEQEEQDLEALAEQQGENFALGEEAEDAILQGYNINNTIAEEKASAIESLGTLCEHTKQQFMSHLPKTIEIVQELCDHPHENVRRGAMYTLFKIMNTTYDIFCSDLSWQPSYPPNYQVPNDVQQVINIVINETFKVLDEEEDKIVVNLVLTELGETMKKVGPALIGRQTVMDTICQHAMNVLTKKASCQVDLEQTETPLEDEQENAELDSLVINSAADLVGAIAVVSGGYFARYFKHFWPQISKYYKPHQPVSDRSMAIGVIGEISGGLGSDIMPFTEELLQFALAALNDEDDEVKSNAAFAIGMICKSSPADISPRYPEILAKLYPLLQATSNEPMVDNACGAICRMILSRPALVPNDQVLPVVINCLPLSRDFAENAPVYRCIRFLFEKQDNSLLSLLPKLVPILVNVLLENKAKQGSVKVLTKETEENVTSVLKTALQNRELFGAISPSLTAQQKTLIEGLF